MKPKEKPGVNPAPQVMNRRQINTAVSTARIAAVNLIELGLQLYVLYFLNSLIGGHFHA